MDPKIVKEVLDFKLHNQYPEGLTSKEKYVIKRRAETFRIKDGDLYYMCRRKRNQAQHLAKVVVQCPPCQSRRAPIKEKTQYNPIVVSEPLELVGMDLTRAQSFVTRSLNKVVADHPKDWDLYLQATMFALRTKKQLTTKYSPYFLMFGREARYPSEVDEEYEVTDDKVNRLLCLEEISEGAHKRQSVYEDVKHNVKKSQDRVGPYKVYSENMMDLVPGKELETEVVNAYLCIVGRRTGYPVDQVGVATLRLDMAMSMLNDTDDLSQLCRACGEESSGADTDWIECTTTESTEEDYFCKGCIF
ncbi:hypothetical protein DPEC_G00248030 [Dallia pectoralis]|uniref:Uncharacterized protein n=1 Tax=Dallia pectoralis TaxID=75939 RepID=A0ACC2FWP3_DALPE|nr:hypothetical protein DPEC_G00248030 [Dallia pectoralis]